MKSHKVNKKTIVILAAVFLTFILTGCPMETTNKAAASSIHRMVIVEVTGEGYDIVYDKKTKVMYAVSQGYYNMGNFTLLVNSDGTPLLYEEE